MRLPWSTDPPVRDRLRDSNERPRSRLRYEFVVVICVRAPSWHDAILSRFVARDRRMAEGREKAEEVLEAMRGAGLTLRVKRHLARDGSKLLLAFVTAAADRLAVQSDRLAVEKWLTEERSLESGGGARFGVDSKPATRVVRVGGLRCASRSRLGVHLAVAGRPGGVLLIG